MACPYQWTASQRTVSLALGLGTLPAYQLAACSTNLLHANNGAPTLTRKRIEVINQQQQSREVLGMFIQ